MPCAAVTPLRARAAPLPPRRPAAASMAHDGARAAPLRSPAPRQASHHVSAPFRGHARRSVAAAAVKKTFPSFDAMIEGSDVPVLVDFYATW